MHQPLHLCGRDLHKEAVALDATDHPRQGLPHKLLRRTGLNQRQGITLNLNGRASPAVEATHQT